MKIYKTEAGKQRLLQTYDQLLSAWGVDFEEEDHETTFGSTHIIRAGAKDAPPLLMFHGVGDDSAMMWVYNAKELSRHFSLIAVDTIGGPGKSVPNRQYETRFDAKQWIGELLASLRLQSANVLGVSYGCHLVQMMLTELPEAVEKAVGISGLPAIEGRRQSKWRGILRFLPEALFPTDRNCFKLVKKISGSNARMFTENPVLWAHWKSVLRDFNQQAMMRQRMKPIDAARLLAVKEKIRFIVGDVDVLDMAAVDQARSMGYTITVLKDTGHGVNHERAELVHREILSFLCPSETGGV